MSFGSCQCVANRKQTYEGNMASRYSIDRYSDDESDTPDIDQDRLFSFTCINLLVIWEKTQHTLSLTRKVKDQKTMM